MLSKNIIIDFFHCFSVRNLEKLESLLHGDITFYFPKTQPLLGKDRVVRFFKILFRQYSELKFDIVRIIRDKESAAIHWINKGLTRKGETYENEGVTILEVREGKIVFISDFFKDTERF